MNDHLAALPHPHGLDEGQDDLALDAEGQPLEAVVELPAEGWPCDCIDEDGYIKKTPECEPSE